MIDYKPVYLPEFLDCKFYSFPTHREVGEVTTKNPHLSGVLRPQLLERLFTSRQKYHIVGFRSSEKELGDCESNP